MTILAELADWLGYRLVAWDDRSGMTDSGPRSMLPRLVNIHAHGERL